MQVGDVTEPLRTQRGYQLLKVETRTETRVKTFEQARADISNKVADQKRQVELLKYLDQLREQATITWRNDELKRAYEQALEKRRKQQGAAPPAGARAAGDAAGEAVAQPRWTIRPSRRAGRRRRRVVCPLDEVAPRAGRPHAARTEGHRSVPAHGDAVEPVEGPQEEDRLAALSRLLFRAVRSAAAAERVEVRRSGEHRLGRR